jgi:GNAT superfamily N-acetyltransferase
VVRFPSGWRCERLRREHPRAAFASGQDAVDGWLTKQALQNQEKHLSVTRVLLDDQGEVAGFYTLATGQVDFGDLPAELVKKLPRRALPVAVLAWLGLDRKHQGQGLGTRLLAQALVDCHGAGQTFAFVAVILDCVDDRAKAFKRSTSDGTFRSCQAGRCACFCRSRPLRSWCPRPTAELATWFDVACAPSDDAALCGLS